MGRLTITFRGASGRSTEPVCWAVGRDLLLRGLTDPAGEGDVLLFPSVDENGRAAVVMELCSPDGRLVTQLRSSDLYRFLSQTLMAVPLGTESIDLDQLVGVPGHGIRGPVAPAPAPASTPRPRR